MNCPQCGCPVEDGALFCTNCGIKLDQGGNPAQPQMPHNPAAAFPGQGDGMPPHSLPISSSPLWQGLRKTLSSKPFLMVAVFLSLTLGLAAFGIISGGVTPTPTPSPAPGNSQTVSLVLGSILGFMPIILYTAGAWLLRISSKGQGPLKGAGLIRGASIIMIIVMGMALFLLGFAMIPFLLAWSSGKIAGNISGYQELMDLFNGQYLVGYIVFGILFLACLIVLLYYVKLSALSKIIREVDATGMQTRPIPSFLNFAHVSLIILSLLGTAGIVLSQKQLKAFLAQQGYAADVSLIGILSSVISLGLLISLFLSIRSLKKNLR